MQDWLAQFHHVDCKNKPELSTKMYELAGEVDASNIERQFTSIHPFPYYPQFNQEAAKRIAVLLTARNKLLKISFYLDKLQTLMDKGGVLALIFSKRTIKILLQFYRNVLEEFGQGQKDFYDLCQQVGQVAVTEGQKRGVLGWMQDQFVQPGGLKEWMQCQLQTNRLADEKKIEELVDLANKTTLNLSQLSKEEITKDIAEILDVITEGLTQVLVLDKEFVVPKPAVIISAGTTTNTDEDLESSLHFAVVRDTWKDEAQENYIQHLQAEALGLYKSLEEASKSVATTEQKCEELQDKLEYIEQVLEFYRTGKPPKKGFRNGETLHDVQSKALQKQKETYDKRIAVIEQRSGKQAADNDRKDELFIQYKLQDSVRCKVNEVLKAENAKSILEYEQLAAAESVLTDVSNEHNPIMALEFLGKCNVILRNLGSAFMLFTHHYSERIQQGYSGFFHASHGDSGLRIAKNQQKTWEPRARAVVNKAFEEIQKLSEQEIHRNLIAAIDTLLAQAKTQLREQQTGNLHRHSSKTYLIAYCKMLEQVKYQFTDSKSITDFYSAYQADNLFQAYYSDKVQDGGELASRDFRQNEYARLTAQTNDNNQLVPSASRI